MSLRPSPFGAKFYKMMVLRSQDLLRFSTVTSAPRQQNREAKEISVKMQFWCRTATLLGSRLRYGPS